MLRFLIVALASLALSACKLSVIVTGGGDVQSLSGTRDCAGGNVCEFEITDTTFTESFTAVPRDGYQFVKWRKGGSDFFCPDSPNASCILSNVGGAGNTAIESIVASFAMFHIMPVFEFVGIDTDEDGIKDHLDPDDDNDGLLDGVDPCPLNPDPACVASSVVLEQLIANTCWTVSVDVGNAAAQTFIAPATGSLTEIGFAIQGDGASTNLVILEGDINGSTVFFQAINTPVISGAPAAMMPYTLNVPLAVTSGQLYTIAIDDTGGFGLRFCGSSANPYDGGNAYQVKYFSSTSFPADDAAFSVTIE